MIIGTFNFREKNEVKKGGRLMFSPLKVFINPVIHHPNSQNKIPLPQETSDN